MKYKCILCHKKNMAYNCAFKCKKCYKKENYEYAFLYKQGAQNAPQNVG